MRYLKDIEKRYSKSIDIRGNSHKILRSYNKKYPNKITVTLREIKE